MGGACSTHGLSEKCIGLKEILVRKPKVRKLLERSRRRWGNNIKMNFKEIWYENVNLINLAQNRGQWRILVNKNLGVT